MINSDGSIEWKYIVVLMSLSTGKKIFQVK
ncbi:Uncharacterised protein [Vibrio cholerae]|nr:Uncharacterised protein [Vibrio cholerae]